MKKTCILAVLLAVSLLLPSCQAPKITESSNKASTPYESPSMPIESAEPTEPLETPTPVSPTESASSGGKYIPLLSDFVINKDLDDAWLDDFEFEFAANHPLGNFKPLDYLCDCLIFGFEETILSKKRCWVFGIPKSYVPSAYEWSGEYPDVQVKCNYTILLCYREEFSTEEYRVVIVTPEYPGSGPDFVLFGIPQDCLDWDPDKYYDCTMFFLSEKDYSEGYRKSYVRFSMDSYYEEPIASGYLRAMVGQSISLAYEDQS